MMVGKTVVRTWSRLQGSVSLSSAEADYYAMIAGLSEAMGLQHFLEELGLKFNIRLLTDSSAAKAGAERLGLLHQKHMKIRDLFLKDLVAQGVVTVEKINTKENPSDFLTKPVTAEVLDACLSRLSFCREAEKTYQVIMLESSNEYRAELEMEIERRVREVEGQIYVLVQRRKLLLHVWWIIHRWGWLPMRRYVVARSFVEDHENGRQSEKERTRSKSV
jgi:hypothetical protein